MPAQTRLDFIAGDTGPVIDFHVVRMHPTAGGTQVNLTGASAMFSTRIQASGGAGPVATLTATVNGASGATAGHTFVFPSAFSASVGQLLGRLTVFLSDGTIQTAPPEDPFLIVVHARI